MLFRKHGKFESSGADTSKRSSPRRDLPPSPGNQWSPDEDDPSDQMDDRPESGGNESATPRFFSTASFSIVVFVFLFVLVRLVFLAHAALSLPYALKCLVWILLAELAVIVGWAVWRGWKLYRDLPPAFDQANSANDDETNRAILERYVNADGLLAPKNDSGAADLLAGLQNPDNDYNGGGEGWMSDFMTFQKHQDEAAHAIARTAAIRIAAATATSRWSAVDMAVTLYLSSKMIVDIATIYNRRISSRQSFRLALGWATGVAVSGQAGAVGGRIGTMIGDGSGNWISSVLEKYFTNESIATTIGRCLGVGTGFAFGKLTEGAANAFLALRLGNRAIRAFRATADA